MQNSEACVHCAGLLYHCRSQDSEFSSQKCQCVALAHSVIALTKIAPIHQYIVRDLEAERLIEVVGRIAVVVGFNVDRVRAERAHTPQAFNKQSAAHP